MPAFRPSSVPTAEPTGVEPHSPNSGTLVADAISLTIHTQHATRSLNKLAPHGSGGIARLASSNYGALPDRFYPQDYQADLLDNQWLAFPEDGLHDP